jgi:hypothetical protein
MYLCAFFILLPLHFLHFFIKLLHSYNALHQRY